MRSSPNERTRRRHFQWWFKSSLWDSFAPQLPLQKRIHSSTTPPRRRPIVLWFWFRTVWSTSPLARASRTFTWWTWTPSSGTILSCSRISSPRFRSGSLCSTVIDSETCFFWHHIIILQTLDVKRESILEPAIAPEIRVQSLLTLRSLMMKENLIKVYSMFDQDAITETVSYKLVDRLATVLADRYKQKAAALPSGTT